MAETGHKELCIFDTQKPSCDQSLSLSASAIFFDLHSAIKGDSGAGNSAIGTIQTPPTGDYITVSTGRAILSGFQRNLI